MPEESTPCGRTKHAITKTDYSTMKGALMEAMEAHEGNPPAPRAGEHFPRPGAGYATRPAIYGMMNANPD
eukprot:11019849-Heterocapsa_arctica.AAC.1